ncbi:unnamed protein product [Mycena citricolor]|uniref:Tr-type G domain-containing protein n=1 Tax=Mycena citricolor TaxID=2018698 RepID=A0AAD2HKC6_9AGAR|nr:unnamed protein product [Mycena citricolor]
MLISRATHLACRSFRASCYGKWTRAVSSAASHKPEKIRNIALVAHIDSGKTTLTESILLKSEYLPAAGTVDSGSTTTDFLPAERERGITIQSASIPVRWKEWVFNLIDTPGHADFGMEVESASRVVDGAVVLLDAVEGVEAQTLGVWKQLDRYGVKTRMIFLNKLDRPGASFGASIASLLSHQLHPHPVAVTLPVASFDPIDYTRAEPGIQGIVDLLNWELWRWDAPASESETPTVTRHKLPLTSEELAETPLFPAGHPLLEHLGPARIALVDAIAMTSEDIMEYICSVPPGLDAYLELKSNVLMNNLREATLGGDLLPVVCGSAMKHIGTDLVMDYIGGLFASPLDVLPEKETKVPVPSSSAPVRLLAWKVTWHKRLGWMTFVRVYSGKLTRRITLLNQSQGNAKERISKLLLLYAQDMAEVEELGFGSVGVILGMRGVRTGDVLSNVKDVDEDFSLQIRPPPPVISASVIPRAHADLQPVQDALLALSRTDPSVRIETSGSEGQMLAHGLGALHLEIVEGRLKDEWGVNCVFGARRVGYRESVGSTLRDPNASNVWKSEVGGATISVEIVLKVRALTEEEVGDPTWDGNVVVDADNRPFDAPAIGTSQSPTINLAAGIQTALSNSPFAALPLVRTHVQVVSFSLPPSAPPTVLQGAGAVLLREHLKSAGPGDIMEPWINVRVTVTGDSVGRVVRDLGERGGRVVSLGGTKEGDELDEGYSTEGVYVPPLSLSPSTNGGNVGRGPAARQTIVAQAPLSQMLDYALKLRALTGGHGQFEQSTAGYYAVSADRKQEVLRELGRA